MNLSYSRRADLIVSFVFALMPVVMTVTSIGNYEYEGSVPILTGVPSLALQVISAPHHIVHIALLSPFAWLGFRGEGAAFILGSVTYWLAVLPAIVLWTACFYAVSAATRRLFREEPPVLIRNIPSALLAVGMVVVPTVLTFDRSRINLCLLGRTDATWSEECFRVLFDGQSASLDFDEVANFCMRQSARLRTEPSDIAVDGLENKAERDLLLSVSPRETCWESIGNYPESFIPATARQYFESPPPGEVPAYVQAQGGEGRWVPGWDPLTVAYWQASVCEEFARRAKSPEQRDRCLRRFILNRELRLVAPITDTALLCGKTGTRAPSVCPLRSDQGNPSL